MSAQPDAGAELQEATAALRRQYPGMPPGLEERIAGHAFRARGRECAWFDLRLPRWARVDALVTAWVRHELTPYDELLPREGDAQPRRRRQLARDLVQARIRATLAAWRRPPDGR